MELRHFAFAWGSFFCLLFAAGTGISIYHGDTGNALFLGLSALALGYAVYRLSDHSRKKPRYEWWLSDPDGQNPLRLEATDPDAYDQSTIDFYGGRLFRTTKNGKS